MRFSRWKTCWQISARATCKRNKPGGSIKLTATEIASTADTATCRFVCADTGIGMSEEFVRHAFEPNGLDVVRAIRALNRPDSSSVAVFALSANAFADDVQASLDAGMNVHLTKPLERDKILQAIVEFASRKRRSPKCGRI